jgi:hypothetical protein
LYKRDRVGGRCRRAVRESRAGALPAPADYMEEEPIQDRRALRGVVLGACIALTTAGCGRDEKSTPPAEDRAQAAQPANHPQIVTGCLKAGDAPDTFVVTAARTAGSTETATYQLLGKTDVNLADHIGRQVEVSGTVKETRELASRDRPPAAQPQGTTGDSKPVVETRTEVDIKKIDISAVKPLGNRCE